jgi:hypothetical protein
MTDADLDRLAKLAAEANPGPYFQLEHGDVYRDHISGGGAVSIFEDEANRYPHWPTGAFVAAADPGTVAALVAEVLRLRAEVDGRNEAYEIMRNVKNATAEELMEERSRAAGLEAEVARLRAALAAATRTPEPPCPS